MAETHSPAKPGVASQADSEKTKLLSDEASNDSESDSGQPEYARVKAIARFVPKAEPEEEDALSWKNFAWWASLKLLLLAACVLSFAVLVINTIGTVVLSTQFHSPDIYHGSCNKAGAINSALHIIINILSTALLGASNMCMQFLAAPTRKQVDAAHKAGRWLDVGIPSVGNLWRGSWHNRILWFALVISSAPLAFLWNSAVSQTIPMSSPEILVVTPDFLSGGVINATAARDTVAARLNLPVSGLSQSTGKEVNTTLGTTWGTVIYGPDYISLNDTYYRQIQHAYQAGQYSKKLTSSECLVKYQNIAGNASNGLLVSSWDEVLHEDPRTLSNNTLLWTWFAWGIEGPGSYWVCGNTNTFDCRKPQVWENDPALTKDWNVFGYKIDYCLINELHLEDLCSINYDRNIMIVVCVVNAIKCICIFWTALHFLKQKDAELFVTTGDAIISYLKKPEDLTKNACLASRSDIVSCRIRPIRALDTPQTHPASQLLPRKYEEGTRPRWFHGASRRLWCTTLISALILFVSGVALLGPSLEGIKTKTGSTNGFVNLGFGSVHVQAEGFLGHLYNASYWVQFYLYVLFANVWQLLISSVYFQYNALLTSLLVNNEWQAYSRYRKGLRVSWPKSLQRDAYFLSLPWTYGLPLQISIAFLHYTLSQSVFVVVSELYTEGGVFSTRIAANGYSIWPIITSIIYGSIVIAFPIVLGFRRYKQAMPLDATCSLVISAACHRPGADKEAHLFPVQWGYVPSDTDVAADAADSSSHQDDHKTPSPTINSDAYKKVVPTTGQEAGTDPEKYGCVKIKGNEKKADTSNASSGISSAECATGVIGHCSFTTYHDAKKPVEGHLYA